MTSAARRYRSRPFRTNWLMLAYGMLAINLNHFSNKASYKPPDGIRGFYNTTSTSAEGFAGEDPVDKTIDYTQAYVRFVNAISNAIPMGLYATHTTTLTETAKCTRSGPAVISQSRPTTVRSTTTRPIGRRHIGWTERKQPLGRYRLAVVFRSSRRELRRHLCHARDGYPFRWWSQSAQRRPTASTGCSGLG